MSQKEEQLAKDKVDAKEKKKRAALIAEIEKVEAENAKLDDVYLDLQKEIQIRKEELKVLRPFVRTTKALKKPLDDYKKEIGLDAKKTMNIIKRTLAMRLEIDRKEQTHGASSSQTDPLTELANEDEIGTNRQARRSGVLSRQTPSKRKKDQVDADETDDKDDEDADDKDDDDDESHSPSPDPHDLQLEERYGITSNEGFWREYNTGDMPLDLQDERLCERIRIGYCGNDKGNGQDGPPSDLLRKARQQREDGFMESCDRTIHFIIWLQRKSCGAKEGVEWRQTPSLNERYAEAAREKESGELQEKDGDQKKKEKTRLKKRRELAAKYKAELKPGEAARFMKEFHRSFMSEESIERLHGGWERAKKRAQEKAKRHPYGSDQGLDRS